VLVRTHTQTPKQAWRRYVLQSGCISPCCIIKFQNFRYSIIFTARCYASAVLAMGLCLSVCLCLSVTSRSSTKTAKRRITRTTPHDSPGTLVFWCQRSPRNSTGVTPYEGAECRWGVSKSATFDKLISGYISKTVKDRHIVSIKVE